MEALVDRPNSLRKRVRFEKGLPFQGVLFGLRSRSLGFERRFGFGLNLGGFLNLKGSREDLLFSFCA